MTDCTVRASGVLENAEVLTMIGEAEADTLAIERVASYGMSVGREVFETCEWVGEFRCEWRRRGKGEAILIYRRDVKLHLCGTSKAKDANIRQALIDKFGPGKDVAVGRKPSPGPLYGVKSHAWAALGVAVTVAGLTPEAARAAA